MSTALIGYTGYVGGTLLKQTSFTHLFRSTNIGDIAGGEFDLTVCAGAPGQKWLANRDPESDLRNLDHLMAQLKTIDCKFFILISTVDVFPNPNHVDEDTVVDTSAHHAYGRNRRELEKFVAQQFPNHLIIRLPGLVGHGLRKNAIFDLLNNNNLSAIDSRGVFQFYPMINLWADIQVARDNSLNLVHLTSAPTSIAEIAQNGFGREFKNHLQGTPAQYDMRTKHAVVFGKTGFYHYEKNEVFSAVQTYAQSEPMTGNGA